MRVRVKFRYRADTGEVEVFEVEDMRSGPRLADHDARHERAAADVARIVEHNAIIEEMPAGVEVPTRLTVPTEDEPTETRRERQRDD